MTRRAYWIAMAVLAAAVAAWAYVTYLFGNQDGAVIYLASYFFSYPFIAGAYLPLTMMRFRNAGYKWWAPLLTVLAAPLAVGTVVYFTISCSDGGCEIILALTLSIPVLLAGIACNSWICAKR